MSYQTSLLGKYEAIQSSFHGNILNIDFYNIWTLWKKNSTRKAFVKSLKDEIKILREGSGLNFLIKPLVNIDLDKLDELCKQKEIKIYFKEFFNLEKVIALGFGGFEDFEIKNAIKVFSEVWFEAKSS